MPQHPAQQAHGHPAKAAPGASPDRLREKLSGIADPIALLEGLVAHSPVPYIIFKADGHPLLNNRAYREMFGAEPPAEYNLFADEVTASSGLAEAVRQAFRGETVRAPTVWYDPKALQHIQVEEAKRAAISCTFFPLLAGDGQVTHVAVAFKDVTAEWEARERAEAERDLLRESMERTEALARELRASQDRLRFTLEAAEVGTWEWDITENRVHWSPNIEQLFGLAPGSFAGTYEAWLALIHPDDREGLKGEVDAALGGGRGYQAEFRYLRPDGSFGWQMTRGHAVRDEAGRPRALRGVVIDVTARRDAEDTLRQSEVRLQQALASMASSERHYRFLAESLPGMVWTSQPDGRVDYCNAKWVEYTGLDLTRTRTGWDDAVHPEDREHVHARWREAKRSGTTFEAVYRLRRASDGAYRWFLGRSMPMRDASGQPEKWFGTSTDIHDQKLAEEASRTQAQVLESMLEGVSISDERGFIVYTNPAEDALFGYERGELIGKHVSIQNTYPPEENQRIVAEVIAQLKTKGAWMGEFSNVKKDGTAFTTRARITGLELSGRKYWVCVQEDVTQERWLEEETRKRADFEQQLIGIVSHDLRNPISAIAMTATALLRREDLDPRTARSLLRIVNSSDRATRMIRDLLDFTQSRLGGGLPIQPAPTDLHRVIEQVVEEVQATDAERDIVVRQDGDGQGRWDEDRLAQVATNLLTNALNYSPRDTPVRVTTREEGDAVVLEVHNRGEPIPPELLPTLFHPMHRGTAKVDKSKRSIGLGLYIVKEIATAHGGTVAVRSDAREGTTFVVRLPRQAPLRRDGQG